MTKFIELLQHQVEKPGLFSTFHLIGIILILLTTITISLLFKNCKEKTYKRIIWIFYIVLIVLEILKQLVKSYHPGDPSYWKYDFYDFPFHLCSTVYYVIPVFLSINREKHPKIYDALLGYFSFFVLFAGVLVTLYTGVVFSTYLYTNIQTLVHHGSQIVLGVFMLVWNRKTVSIKTYFRSLIPSAIMLSLAVVVNMILSPIANNEIDMFYANPFNITPLPLFSTIQQNFGFIPFIIAYYIGLGIMGFITYLIGTLPIYIKRKHQKVGNI